MTLNTGILSHTCKYYNDLHFSCKENALGYFSLSCSAGIISLPSPDIQNEVKQLHGGNTDK